MPVSRSIQLARLFGIRIGASPSWFLVLFLMIYLLSGYFRDVLEGSSEATAYLVAVLAAFLFFVSLVLHELGHALVARRQGIGIAGIDLWFFGGLAKMTRDTRSPGEEAKVAGAGPLVTLLVVGLAFGAGLALSRVDGVVDSAILADTATTPAVALLGWLAAINVALLIFNLIPAFPLDGGRLARALAWRLTGDRHRGTRLSARLGQGFGLLLIGGGVFLLLTGTTFDGLWFALLGWFLLQAASGAVTSSRFSERLEAITVADVMDADPVAVPAGTPALEAQEGWFLRYGWPWFCVVDDDGRYVGVLAQARVDEAVAGGRPAVPVAELAAREESVQGDAPVEDLLGSEPLLRCGGLAVVDTEGRLRGVVTADRVRRALSAAVTT